MNVFTEKIKSFYNNLLFLKGKLRAKFWSIFAKHIGKEVYLLENVLLYSPGGVSIGDYVSINYNTTLSGAGGLKIGNYVNIGPNSMILTSEHRFDRYDVPMAKQGITVGPVELDDDVWIGANVVICPNVKIGRGSIVAAHAVVTKDVEPYSIVGGVPAKLIKYRFDKDTIAKAMKTKFPL